MTRLLRPLLLVALSWFAATAQAADGERLVFGSFRSQDNAFNLALRLTERFAQPMEVERIHGGDGVWYRVCTAPLGTAEQAELTRQAQASGIPFWRVSGTLGRADTVTSSMAGGGMPDGAGAASTAGAMDAVVPGAPEAQPAEDGGHATQAPRPSPDPTDAGWLEQMDVDLGLQTRSYFQRGLAGQSRFQPSLSLRLDQHRTWDDERQSFTFSPFLRLDAEDDERTHFDLREMFWTRVGPDWELHAGFKQVFWGQTEFLHLVDIVNQTDLVENIDGEDKLGQPMVQLSLIRDWGILDFFVLTGFRERTFPGQDGRLRPVVPVDVDDPLYESGAGQARIDGAVRWSHHWGPLNFGVYHFSGTSRDPVFVPQQGDDGDLVLRPLYRVIDQTGFDGQAIFGDWAFKLETITRSGDGDRYVAATGGFERTLVGVLGSRSDLGIILEYMYDERGDAAHNTLFERDLALGARWSLNDMADSQALLGIIRDVDTDEYVYSLEASRRLGLSWTLLLEARIFGGAGAPEGQAPLEQLLSSPFKSAALQRDDYLQLELTRYF